MSSAVFDISYIVKVLDQFKDSCACRRGVLVRSLKVAPNGCYPLHFNVPDYTLISFINCKEGHMYILVLIRIKRCALHHRNMANVKNVTTQKPIL